MATLVLDYTFVPGQLALASEINSNFQKIQAWAAGQLGTENISSLTARPEGGPILQFMQTAAYPSISINNNSASSVIKITQGQLLNENERILWIQDSFVQTAPGASHIFLGLNQLATIPAILVSHGVTNTFELTSSYLRLETLFKPTIRTTAQRNAIINPEEGSVLYNTDTDELNVKREDAWMPVGVPVGSMQMFAGSVAPEGWLLCGDVTLDSVANPQYAKLFAVIGTTYGGTGASSFKLPNTLGRTIIGVGTGVGLTARALADTGGTETHTLTIAQMPSHTHQYFDYYNEGELSDDANDRVVANDSNPQVERTTGATGGGQPHNNMQPFLALNYIIKY